MPSGGGPGGAPRLPGHVHRKEREIEGGTAGKGGGTWWVGEGKFGLEGCSSHSAFDF